MGPPFFNRKNSLFSVSSSHRGRGGTGSPVSRSGYRQRRKASCCCIASSDPRKPSRRSVAWTSCSRWLSVSLLSSWRPRNWLIHQVHLTDGTQKGDYQTLRSITTSWSSLGCEAHSHSRHHQGCGVCCRQGV
jgi:hypothetical protein